MLVGRYVSENANLIRTQPLDCAVGAPASQVPGHPGRRLGRLHVRRLRQDHRPAGGARRRRDLGRDAVGSPQRALGSSMTENLVTRAMELSPAGPSYLDMRNAILQADQVVNGGNAHDTIWKVFAHRGMGYFAASDRRQRHPSRSRTRTCLRGRERRRAVVPREGHRRADRRPDRGHAVSLRRPRLGLPGRRPVRYDRRERPVRDRRHLRRDLPRRRGVRGRV